MKKNPSILFRLSRLLKFILKGVGKKENEHFLFKLDEPLYDVTLYSRLAHWGWTPNYMGYTYKCQIYQCRCLLHNGKHQYHVRCYEDGTITGHYEIAPEWDASDHLKGVDLKKMNAESANRLFDEITGVAALRNKYKK